MIYMIYRGPKISYIFTYITIYIFLTICGCSISMPESIGLEIEKACQSIFPLQNVCIRKVKVLRKPKFDLVKLMELHGDSGEDTGAALDKAAAETTVQALSGAGGRL